MSKQTQTMMRYAIAVEFGNDWIKIAQFSDPRGGTLKSVVVKNLEGPSSQVVQTMIEAMAAEGVKPGPVLALIPRPMVTVRMLEFPSVDPAEIADMVDLQVTRQTPYSRDEIVFGFKTLGSERAGYSRVMLIIMQSSLVRQRFGLLEEAGLHVVQISVATEAMLEWAAARIIQPGATGDLALLDVDAGHADFCILRNGHLVFNRSIPVGAQALVAEGDNGQAQMKLYQELARAIETFRGEMPGAKLERMVIGGAAIEMPVITKQLQQEFGVAAEVLSSWDDPALDAKRRDDAVSRTFSISALLGVALRRRDLTIDLTPEAVHIRRDLAVRARSLTTFGILVMAFLGLAALFVESRLERRLVEVRYLRGQALKAGNDADAVKTMRDRVELIKVRLDRRTCTLNLLHEIARLVPDTINFTAIQIDEGGQIVLRGGAATESDVLKFVNVLDGSPLMTGVKSTRVTGRERKDFEIIGMPEK